jgi:hypothetical protein
MAGQDMSQLPGPGAGGGGGGFTVGPWAMSQGFQRLDSGGPSSGILEVYDSRFEYMLGMFVFTAGLAAAGALTLLEVTSGWWSYNTVVPGGAGFPGSGVVTTPGIPRFRVNDPNNFTMTVQNILFLRDGNIIDPTSGALSYNLASESMAYRADTGDLNFSFSASGDDSYFYILKRQIRP